MLPLFSVTLLISALLLFLVQPMIAKMLLPLLGGTPTVWNTCMVFFQAMLLAGYGYSHVLTKRLSLRTQGGIHFLLLLVTLAVLPIGLSAQATQSVPWQSDPSWWLLKTLVVMVGLPFFTVSTSGPLLQHWFSRTGHRSARDPYFLYAASNLGSLLALLAYPVLIEPAFRLQQQAQFWTAAYLVLLVLFGGCAWLTLRAQRKEQQADTSAPALSASTATTAGEPGQAPASSGTESQPPAWSQRVQWIFWAFIPSSLMLGVTTYLTTDIASVPLLWVIPLALYLLTFILAFARRQVLSLSWLLRLLPIMAVALTFLLLTDVKNPIWLLIGLHLGFFFVAAMVSHMRLAGTRPSPEHLTEFYLWLSVGGVLGGLFNALISPAIFKTVVEYPLGMVLACLARPVNDLKPSGRWWSDLGVAAGIGVVTGLLAVLVPQFGLEPYQLWVLVIFGLPLLGCYFCSRQPLRFALALGAVMLGSKFYTAIHGQTLLTERNFYGALRVTLDPEQRIHRFYHGTTIHGSQFVNAQRQREPLSYYHRTGPFGQAFEAYALQPAGSRVGVIGLGAGAMICYALPGQTWTFYEIDPAVVQVAQSTPFFSYLRDSTNVTVQHKLGDARLRLREAPDGSYGLLICDAFSSDVPPLHLMTREAFELYSRKLAPDGLLCFNISSRYLDFRPILGNLAEATKLYALGNNESEITPEAQREGKYSSHWIVMARQPLRFGKLLDDSRWLPVLPDPERPLWTDDYSNVLSIFQWQ
jgi:hypothetical protein